MNGDLTDLKSIIFGVLSAEDVRKHSVVEISSAKINGSGSVSDERMGIELNNDGKCITCNTKAKDCSGHFGHIELHEPILHCKLIKHVVSFLKCQCMKCYEPLITQEKVELFNFHKFKRNIRFDKIIEHITKKAKVCPLCNAIQPNFSVTVDKNIVSTYGKDKTVAITIPLSARDILAIFSALSNDSVRMFGFDPSLVHPKNFILQNILVIPPCARPSVMGDKPADDDLTIQYIEILKANDKLVKIEENKDENKHQSNIQNLIFRIRTMMDNRKGEAKSSNGSGKPFKGISDRLCGKTGQFRFNLMGKRVEQSARSVIDPDPTLRLGEIGVPIEVAKILTFPEVVNSLNKERLTKIIWDDKANGIIRNEMRIKLKYALHDQSKTVRVMYGDEIVRRVQGIERRIKYYGAEPFLLKSGDAIIRNGIELPYIMPSKKKFELQEGDVVERHLQDDDLVLLNRQPTLHKGSMMTHRVRVLPCKSFRFNLAATKSFNADYDGDEMNIHAPQSYESKAELQELCSTSQNIISLQSSKPNILIVQDSLLASYLMTNPNVGRLDKSEFFDIANEAISVDGSPLPTNQILEKIKHIQKILRMKGKDPFPFTGKGLFSLALPNDFNYEAKNGINDAEPVVRIYKGVLYEGVINKNDYTAHNSITQLIYKEYGREAVSTFIDNIQFITNKWLRLTGFSVGIKDCIPTKTGEIADAVNKCIMEASMIEETTQHPGIREVRVNGALSKARDIGLRIAKNSLKDGNGFVATVNAGSKGDFFNIAQITGLLGQQNLRGNRIPKFMNKGKRVLPHYPFSGMNKKTEYESRGFISNSFHHGLSPQEFYLHAVASREGITNTALSTGKSGYIQRKIIKVMEDFSVKNDLTVRNADNNIYQFMYGDTGLDPAECVFDKGEPFMCNVDRMVDRLNMEVEEYL